MRFLPVNSNALLVELDDLEQTLALLGALQADPVAGVVELVPAARTILVAFRPGLISREALIERIARCDIRQRVERDDREVEIPVHYDGEDLEEVAGLLGISPREVVLRHTRSVYRVAFTGFAPGFAYLSGGDPLFDVPRRATPRTRIPAGSVALAGTFSGVYPQASPGGWQIIGTTPVSMWDLERDPPALLQPGYRVRFVDAGPRPIAGRGVGQNSDAATPSSAAEPVPAGPAFERPALEVRATGLQALFQDLGRQGQAGQGVSASGAMDRGALRMANRLVGNDPGAACVELVYGGFQAVSRGENVVAVSGADVPLTLRAADGASWEVPSHQPIALADGDSLTVGQPRAGIRAYLAVRGGFAVEPVLGSRSTDILAKVGPTPLAVGDSLPVGGAATAAVGQPEPPAEALPTVAETVVLDVVMGPRTDWFTAEAVALLAGQEWCVTPQSDRVGIRLEGDAPLTRTDTRELPSEGTALGAIQVPPSGQPVLFLADHPLTGGYPVIACVASHHLDRAGQIPVGARIRFNPVTAFDPVTRDAPTPDTTDASRS